MTAALSFFSSCHGEYGCFIHGLLLCLRGYFRSSKGDGLRIMHATGGKQSMKGVFSKYIFVNGLFRKYEFCSGGTFDHSVYHLSK